jgi:hypothetical protein
VSVVLTIRLPHGVVDVLSGVTALTVHLFPFLLSLDALRLDGQVPGVGT